MILLWGVPSEAPLAKLNHALLAAGAHVVMLSQRQSTQTRLEWDMVGGQACGRLGVFDTSYALGDFSAVYLRAMGVDELPEVKAAASAERAHCVDMHQALFEWLEVANIRVVNRCSAMSSNCSKPYQAQLIRRHGLLVPPTLITNDPEQVLDFERAQGTLIYKSISGVRSIVKELKAEDKARLEAIRHCPVQFQVKLAGFDVRVHVIGDRAIATKIASGAADYRYAHLDHMSTELSAFELPPHVEDACIRLTAALGLHFSGIDLRVLPSGEVYCFEVNPMPGYSYYEGQTGQPISQALARYLMAE